MPYAVTPDKIKLHYEEVGLGRPILFVHEFAGDHRSWEHQLREFGKRYRCIAYAARGYKPSDVPTDAGAYSYRHVMRDAVAVLDHLEIEQAHLIGLSMGGYTALQGHAQFSRPRAIACPCRYRLWQRTLVYGRIS
jgi:Predicted hydrolases or acyltransferases (alpha/beta hydrolase superfamily)